MKNVSSDVALAYIRERILSGEYSPGYALTTSVLSTEIGVSRTPVRDALRQLEADGLVVIQTHLGASVKNMDLNEFRETCMMRLALETFAAGLAARNHTDDALQEISFALATMRNLTEQILATDNEEPYFRKLVQEDIRFHVAILTAARCEAMKKEILRLHLINRVVSGSAPAEVPPKGAVSKKEITADRREALAEHEEIYQAIVKGNVVATKNAMERHIQKIVDVNLIRMARTVSRSAPKTLTKEEMIYTTGLR